MKISFKLLLKLEPTSNLLLRKDKSFGNMIRLQALITMTMLKTKSTTKSKIKINSPIMASVKTAFLVTKIKVQLLKIILMEMKQDFKQINTILIKMIQEKLSIKITKYNLSLKMSIKMSLNNYKSGRI